MKYFLIKFQYNATPSRSRVFTLMLARADGDSGLFFLYSEVAMDSLFLVS